MFSVDDLIKNATASSMSAAHKNKYDEDLQALPINDAKHLENHLNYLFRTDYNQKWTNELTDGNAYIIKEPYSDGFEFVFANSYVERLSLKNLVKSHIKRRAVDMGLLLNEFVPTLSQTRVDYKDNRVFSFTDIVKGDTTELLNNVIESTKGFDLICLVVHTDQKENYLHAHMLFCLE